MNKKLQTVGAVLTIGSAGLRWIVNDMFHQDWVWTGIPCAIGIVILIYAYGSSMVKQSKEITDAKVKKKIGKETEDDVISARHRFIVVLEAIAVGAALGVGIIQAYWAKEKYAVIAYWLIVVLFGGWKAWEYYGIWKSMEKRVLGK